ncbi:MAG: carbon-nitrogen hydrolase [Chitinophagaceae bacterium]
MTCSNDPSLNLQKTLEKIREAAKLGAQVVCLQELFSSLYFCHVEDHEHFNLAESIPGPTTKILGRLAKEHSLVIISSQFEKRTQGIFHNTTAVLDADGSYLGKYRKMHIPDDPGFYEKFYFTPGDLGYKVFSTRYGKFGILVCWDQWYPEAARITTLLGAQVLFYPTAIGWSLTQDLATNTEQYQAWKLIQQAHAVANGVHVVAVNRVGQESGVNFWGGSFVANPFGSILCEGSHDQEELIIQEIDLGKTDFYRTHWPFLRDRRIDSYSSISQRFLDDE